MSWQRGAGSRAGQPWLFSWEWLGGGFHPFSFWVNPQEFLTARPLQALFFKWGKFQWRRNPRLKPSLVATGQPASTSHGKARKHISLSSSDFLRREDRAARISTIKSCIYVIYMLFCGSYLSVWGGVPTASQIFLNSPRGRHGISPSPFKAG